MIRGDQRLTIKKKNSTSLSISSFVNRPRKNLITKFNFVWHFFLFVFSFDLLLIIHCSTSAIDQQCIRMMDISLCSISKYHYSVHDIQCDSYVNNVSKRFFMLALSLSLPFEGMVIGQQRKKKEMKMRQHLGWRRWTSEGERERISRRHVRMMTKD